MKRGLAVSVLLLFLGCGGSDSPPTHPDTGAGAGQPVPATPNCIDLCQRGATCAATLCNEDTHSMNYDGLASVLAAQCQVQCPEAAVQGITPTQWQCIFQSSCRQVFERNVCGGMESYSC